MKKVAFFDIDKTIYNTHSFFQIVAYEIEQGRATKEAWAVIQELLETYKSGKATYSQTAQKLLETFAQDIKGQKYFDLFTDSSLFFEKNKESFFAYFEAILPKLKLTHDVYIITTNAQFAAEAVVKKFGLTGFISSEFEVVDGVFTGEVSKSLANGKSMISDILEKHGKSGSIAAGDSENDIGMLELVEFPFCISPNDELKKHATEKGWRIVDAEKAEEATEAFLTVLN